MEIFSSFELKNTTLNYIVSNECNTNQKPVYGLQLLPKNIFVKQQKKCKVEPLVQLKLFVDKQTSGFGNGLTMRDSGSTNDLIFLGQSVVDKHITTSFKNSHNHTIEHHLTLLDDAVETYTVFKNTSTKSARLEMLSSFTLGMLSPYYEKESHDLVLHRLQSFWSAEGRLKSEKIENLQLEHAYAPVSYRVERFGSIGSMPVRKYFPFIALEDTQNNVTWGAQLYLASSWQMEISCIDNGLNISGGIADFEFGHWFKDIDAGQAFTTPRAVVAVAQGSVDEISNKLVGVQARNIDKMPEVDKELPVAFNEWCTTWGTPSLKNLKKITDKLKGMGITYLTIDAGWFKEDMSVDGGWDNCIGEWNQSKELFPNGIKEICDYVRENEMIPGIWFEFENTTNSVKSFMDGTHVLKRDGCVIDTQRRVFLDTREKWVQSYLDEKVINFLKENNFGYLKVDYNDTVGVGCDGAESLGEGLRQYVCASQDYFRKIRKEIPDMVIENCSSGGHRLEPSMMEIVSQASFSDAHEGREIPIIAANLHRAIHPAQSQIWAVLHGSDDDDRFYYSMTNTMLGRMCLSGEIYDLSDKQLNIVTNAISFYKQISHIIKDGNSYRYGEPVISYNFPQGEQVMVRENDGEAIITVHTFEKSSESTIELPDCYEVIASFGSSEISIEGNCVNIPNKSFTAAAFHVKKIK